MSTTMASIVGAAFAQSGTSNVTTAAAAAAASASASASASSSQQAGADVTSSGLVNGDNPLHHALLLLIIQIGVIIFLSRFVTFLLRPLKQPRVVAEIVAGILLGPTAFGLIPAFTQNIFPQSSLGILETLANVGLIFFLFLVGLELDIHKLRKTGTATVGIAAAGILLPFALGIIVAYVIYKYILVQPHSQHFGAFAMFIGSSLSITAFPVLARILTERNLLTTDVGQMAMSAAALNDVVAWVLLALAVALTNSGSSPLVALWVVLLGIGFVGFMFLVVGPVAFALARHEEPIPESVVVVTLLLVLGAAFLTDIIGINVIFGGFVCGLLIPSEGPFAGMLREKIEDYVSILFLPLYFASSGLKTNLSAIKSNTGMAMLFMVIGAACVGKIMGTVIVATAWGMARQKAFVLGFLMNTKGLVELIVLNIGLAKGVINEELFAIMVIMAIVTTFLTTPVLMWLYKPARDVIPYVRRKIDTGDSKDELRMLICAPGSSSIPAMMNLVEVTKGREPKSLRAYVLHLMECTDHLSSVSIASLSPEKQGQQRYHQAGVGESGMDAVKSAVQVYRQLSRVKVKSAAVISEISCMHVNICTAAATNRANMIVLPFHMHCHHDGSLETVHSGLQRMNARVLQDTPCSVAIFVDREFGGSSSLISAVMTSPDMNPPPQHICVLFFGGPDDREALMLACRMVQHPGVKLTVIQFTIGGPGQQGEADCMLLLHQQQIEHGSKDHGNMGTVLLQLKRCWKALMWVGSRVTAFFKAPWCNVNPQGSTKSTVESDSCSHIAHCEKSDINLLDLSKEEPPMMETGTHGEVDNHVHQMDIEMYQMQKKLDMIALASMTAAKLAKNKTQSKSLAALDQSNLSLQDLDSTTSSSDQPQRQLSSQHEELRAHEEDGSNSSQGLIFKVCETDDPYKSILEIASSPDYRLIIVGHHMHEQSPILQSGVFPSSNNHVPGQGLGPVGDILVSKDLKHMRASVLVIQQHNPMQSKGPSSCNNNVVNSATDFKYVGAKDSVVVTSANSRSSFSFEGEKDIINPFEPFDSVRSRDSEDIEEGDA